MTYSAEVNAFGEALFGHDLGLNLGPYLLGFFLDAILFGVLIMLFLHWQRWTFPKESTLTRVLIYYLLTCSIGYSAFFVACMMNFFVFNFGDWGVFLDLNFGQWFYLLETISRTPASIFFASRAYRLGNRSKVFVFVVTPFMLTSIGGAIWWRIGTGDVTSDRARIAPAYVWMGSEVVGDLIITGFITYHLARSRTGWKQTDKMISGLILLAMETQFAPTILATIYLLIILIDPSSTLGSTIGFLPNIYTISVLVVLNKRLSLRREIDSERSTYRSRTKETYGLRSRRGVTPGDIQVTTEVVQHVDDLHPDSSSSKDDKSLGLDIGYSSSATRLMRIPT